MDSLIFSLNATVPVFLLMVLGMLFRKVGWMDGEFARQMNRFVFLVPLPLLVFRDLATVDFSKMWDTRYLLFCFVVTLLSILLVTALSFLWKDPDIRGEFIQASYRSSVAILGISLVQNIYGTSGAAPLMLIGSVPLYNAAAVIVLSFFRPGQRGIDRGVIKKSLVGIVTNPFLIAIAIGLLWSAARIPLTGIAEKTVSSIAGMATPMGLISMGASFDMGEAIGKAKPVLASVFLKLVGLNAIFLPIAVWMGFRRDELAAVMVMLGSATTVASFVMAKNMGHEGTLTSGAVMLTTILSAFTLTGWLYVLRSLGLV